MRTVLWDMDGTLADTEELHFHAWHEAMAGEGIEYTYADFLADFGRNNGEILSRIFAVEPGHPRVHAVAARKEELVHELLPAHEMSLMPGVAELLELFEARGVRQVVSSSGTMANISSFAVRLGIADRFMALMSGYRLPRGKPHPALFLNSAAAVGAGPHECLVIEDSLVGVEAARRAGMACVAVGSIAHGPALEALAARLHGLPFLPLPSLTEVRWEQLEALWAAPHSVDAAGKRVESR